MTPNSKASTLSVTRPSNPVQIGIGANQNDELDDYPPGSFFVDKIRQQRKQVQLERYERSVKLPQISGRRQNEQRSRKFDLLGNIVCGKLGVRGFMPHQGSHFKKRSSSLALDMTSMQRD